MITTEQTTEFDQNLQQMARILHDLCQPLTSLQCRMEMAEITGKAQDYRDAVTLGLPECGRLYGHVTALRKLVHSLGSVAPRTAEPARPNVRALTEIA